MPEIAYRLSLAPETEPFRPEIEHALAFLDRAHFVRRMDDSAARLLHYGPNPPADAVAVPNALFPGAVRVDSDGLHPQPSELAAFAAGRKPVRLFPAAASGGERHLAYDAVGLIFLMLSRLEERGGTTDRYGRFPFAAALPVTDAAGVPLADRAALDLAVALTGEAAPRSRTSYEVLLTHDVDRLRGYHRPLEPLRAAAGDMLKRRDVVGAVRRLRDGYFAGEPWASVRWLAALSERKGLQSRFYFLGPSDDSMDSPYALTMKPLLREVIGAIQRRGHVLGFHANFGTAEDPDAWRRKRDGLEEIAGVELREGRHHVLSWRAEATPDIWNDNGMTLDLTLAWPELTGFRSGTCRRYPGYSLRRRRTLGLELAATAIQDFGLFGGKYRNLDVDGALREAAGVHDICRRFGGTLAVLQHTGATPAPVCRFYERLLDEIV